MVSLLGQRNVIFVRETILAQVRIFSLNVCRHFDDLPTIPSTTGNITFTLCISNWYKMYIFV